MTSIVISHYNYDKMTEMPLTKRNQRTENFQLTEFDVSISHILWYKHVKVGHKHLSITLQVTLFLFTETTNRSKARL